MTPEAGFDAMMLSAVASTAEELASMFSGEHQAEAKMAFEEVAGCRKPGRMLSLAGMVPAFDRGDPDRGRYARGELMLALRGCEDRAAEVWLVYAHQRFDELQQAESTARCLAKASKGAMAFAVFQPRHVAEHLH